MVKRAIKRSDTNAQFIMEKRRPEIYGKRDATPAPLENSAPLLLEESKQKLLLLGVLPPILEGDYEEIDAAATEADQRSD